MTNAQVNPFTAAPVIFAYTRANALEDGVLVDVSAMAREAGFTVPVALTSAVNERYVKTHGLAGQDERGRLWDILWMMRGAAQRSKGENEIRFELIVRLADEDFCVGERDYEEAIEPLGQRLVTLKAQCHGGDNGELVITVMMLDED